jgi:GntR family transcriptional regulator
MFGRLRLLADDGITRPSCSRMIRAVCSVATASERQRLDLVDGARVLRIKRLLLRDGAPAIIEDILVPAEMFPDLLGCVLPADLYGFYQTQFNVAVSRVSDRLKAILLDSATAALLEVPRGTPALQIRRIAHDLDERAVELRNSLCLTRDLHYHCHLV